MADNVRFATSEWEGSDPGGFSGFINYLLTAPESGVGNNTSFPIPFTRLEAIETFWRIKGFRVQASITATDPVTHDPVTLTMDATASFAPDGFPFTESDLVRFVGLNTIISPTDEDFFQIDIGSFVREEDDAFYLYFVLKFVINFSFGAPAVYSDESSPTSCGSATFMGHTFGLYSSVDAASATVTPSEYWPYAVQDFLDDGVTPHPNAGLPIYDTATGERLRDPRTGF